MNCLLHIGTEKTGTTTIQNFLHQNRALLLEHGTLFPKSLGTPNNRSLPFIVNGQDPEDDYSFFLFKGGRSRYHRFVKARTRSFQKELKNKKHSKVLFSSEHLHSRLTKREQLVNLKSFLEEQGFASIRVLVYIRDPLEAAISLYATALREGSVLDEVPMPTNFYWQNLCDHKQTFDRWSDIFGTSNIIMRLFQKEDFVHHDLIQDFISAAGLPPDIPYTYPKSANTSLNRTGLLLLRHLNALAPQYTKKRMGDDATTLIGLLERFCSGPSPRPSQEVISAYHDSFRCSNEAIRKAFFPEKNQLFCENQLPGEEEHDIHGLACVIAETIKATQR